jgi:hypothetical protein
MDLPSEVLPTPGGPTKHRIGPFTVFLQLANREMLEDAFLDFLQAVVLGIENRFSFFQVEIVFGGLIPG